MEAIESREDLFTFLPEPFEQVLRGTRLEKIVSKLYFFQRFVGKKYGFGEEIFFKTEHVLGHEFLF